MNYTVTVAEIEDNFAKIMKKLQQKPGISNTNGNGLGQAVFTTTMKAITTVGSGIIGSMNITQNATLPNEWQPGTNYTNSLNTTDNTTEINNDDPNTIWIYYIIGGSIAAIGIGAGVIQIGRYVRAKLQGSIKEKPIDSNNSGPVLLNNPSYARYPEGHLLSLNHDDILLEEIERNSNIYEEVDYESIEQSRTPSEPVTGEDGYLLPKGGGKILNSNQVGFKALLQKEIAKRAVRKNGTYKGANDYLVPNTNLRSCDDMPPAGYDPVPTNPKPINHDVNSLSRNQLLYQNMAATYSIPPVPRPVGTLGTSETLHINSTEFCVRFGIPVGTGDLVWHSTNA